MLLQQLKLQNIRSYTDSVINFPEGSTVLSGDIGCGKSSILLAVEFALFGTSRPDLPAELLLRKGAAQGSVELFFSLGDREIIIKRNLKKDKNSIKQLAGYLIINGVKKDLMPVELKAEIISLLGYPEEFITKNKNYIFRYTIYTPQEEMKFILQEDHETRLDVLRKIFNIDKYKNIRENVQFYLRKMRGMIATLKVRLEPLEEQKMKLEELNLGNERMCKDIVEISVPLQSLVVDVQQKSKEIEELDKEQIIFQKQQQEYKTIIALLKDKNEQKLNFENKFKEISREIDELSIPEGVTIENVELMIKEIEGRRNDLFSKKTQIQERINQIQQKVKETKDEIILFKEQTKSLEEKKKLKLELEEKIKDKVELQNKLVELEEVLMKTSEIISVNQTLLQQSQEMISKISSLETCPTCLQEVTSGHRSSISNVEDEKIKKAESILLESKKKKEDILEQRGTMQKQMEDIVQSQNILTRIIVELQQLEEKLGKIVENEGSLMKLVQENNILMQKMQNILKEEETEGLEKQLKEQQESLNLFNKKQYLEKQISEMRLQIDNNAKSISELINKQKEMEESKRVDLTVKLEEKKKELNEVLLKEKNLSIEKASMQTKLEGLSKQEVEVRKTVDRLNEENIKLIRLKKVYHWLEEYFLKLTYTIEKQVMTNIHGLFSQLFQEWFSILIDDDNIYSRIDDTFSPVIEQNGHEISFNNLSGGEKTSCALAYRLALNRVINDVIHQVKTKDVLILDEPTDGFSSEQLDKVRDVLDRLGLRQTIIVSHESKIESFVDNIIRVVKSGHVSEVS